MWEYEVLDIRKHDHLWLRESRLQVVEVDGGVVGQEPNLGPLREDLSLDDVLDDLARGLDHAGLDGVIRYVENKEVNRRNWRPDHIASKQ